MKQILLQKKPEAPKDVSSQGVIPGKVQAVNNVVYQASAATFAADVGVMIGTRNFGTIIKTVALASLYTCAASAFAEAAARKPGDRLPMILMGAGQGLIGAGLHMAPSPASRIVCFFGGTLSIIGGMLTFAPEVSSKIENGIGRRNQVAYLNFAFKTMGS